MDRGALARLQKIRRDAEQVCGLLSSPGLGVLEQCASVLEGAVARAENCRREAARNGPGAADLLREATLTRESIRQARGMLQQAWDYQGRWGEGLPGAHPGYLPTGEVSTVPRRASFSLSG